MVKDIRITETYVKQLVEQIRSKTGESTPTKTAARLIIERAAQLEITSTKVDEKKAETSTA